MTRRQLAVTIFQRLDDLANLNISLSSHSSSQRKPIIAFRSDIKARDHLG